jgi:hypothetical protein
MIKFYCHICKDYTEHEVVEKIATCSKCNTVYDENRKRYIICGKSDNEKVIKATAELLEKEPEAIIINEEVAFKHRMEEAGLSDSPYSKYIDYPLINYEPELEDFKYGHLTKKEREAKIEPVRTGPKIRRNDLCPCGSGKKWKKCCMNK